MDTKSSLFLAAGVGLLAALKNYNAVEIETFVAANLQNIGIMALVLALVCLKYDKAIGRIANYLALAGITYLLLSNSDSIATILGGLHVF